MGVVFESIGTTLSPGLYKNDRLVAGILTKGRRYLLAVTGEESRLRQDNIEDSLRAYAVRESANARLWHRRLGHLGIDNLKRLRTAADGVHFKDSLDHDCEACLLANQTRSPRNAATAGSATRRN